MKVTLTEPEIAGSYVVAEQRDDGTLVLRPETSDEVIAKNAQPPKEVASKAASAIAGRAQSLGTVGATISAVLATGAVYVLGGATMAVRLYETGLPVERSLSVIPDRDLLILGVRELVLSLVVGGVLFFIAAWRRYVSLAVFVLMAVLVPFTPGGLAWPCALLVLYLYLTYGHCLFAEKHLPAWSVAIAVAVGVCVVTLLRFTDPPLDLALGEVSERADETTSGPSASGVVPPPVPVPPPITGVYLSGTSDEVFLAHRDDDATDEDETLILSIPRDRVRQLDILPPLVGDPPNTSLLGALVRWRGGAPFSWTPLGLWVGRHYYGVRLLR